MSCRLNKTLLFMVFFTAFSSKAEWKKIEELPKVKAPPPPFSIPSTHSGEEVVNEGDSGTPLKTFSLSLCDEYFAELKRVEILEEAALGDYVKKITVSNEKTSEKDYLKFLSEYYLKLYKNRETPSEDEFLNALSSYAISKKKFKALRVLEKLFDLIDLVKNLKSTHAECAAVAEQYMIVNIDKESSPLLASLKKEESSEENMRLISNWSLKIRKEIEESKAKNDYLRLKTLKLIVQGVNQEIVQNSERQASPYPFTFFSNQDKKLLLGALSDLSNEVIEKSDQPKVDRLNERFLTIQKIQEIQNSVSFF